MSRNRHRKIFRPPQSDPELERIAEKIVDNIPDVIKHRTYDGGQFHEHHVSIKIRTQAICVGIPMDELMFSLFISNYVGLHLMPWDQLITTINTYLPNARNAIHNSYLDSLDEAFPPTHLLMLDSDVLPPPDLVERLLAHNKLVVGGWYVKKEKYQIKLLDGSTEMIQRPVVYDFNAEKDGFQERIRPGVGLEKVGGAGAGCWMMSREAALAVGRSPYGDSAGEDLILCRNLAKAGIDMYVDWSISCAHAGVFHV
jgi:hypothetical protein